MDNLNEILIGLGIVVLFIILGYLSRYILKRYLKKYAAKTETQLDDILIKALHGPIIILFVIAGIWLGGDYLKLPEKLHLYLIKGLFIFLVAVTVYVSIKIINNLIIYYGSRNEALKPVANLSQRVVQFLILAIGVIMVLDYFGVSVSSLLATLGIAGLAVALALQDTLANFFAGLHIMADRPIATGHYIKLESGEEGFVQEIGWRSTRIRSLPNNLIIIPNQKLAHSIVTNFSLPENRMSLLLKISVSYNEDPKRVEQVLVEEALKGAEEIEGLLKEPAPFVRFIPGFGDYSLDFTLICQIADFVSQYYAQHELRKMIFDRFKKEGIEIPFPIRTVYLTQKDKSNKPLS
ncbi:MAG TPA: mechanosensitive ion channel family protein [candidate division Zixibacteria bacterium]